MYTDEVLVDVYYFHRCNDSCLARNENELESNKLLIFCSYVFHHVYFIELNNYRCL